MAAGDRPWRLTGGRFVVRVRLSPKSSRDAIEGVEATAEGPALKARVRAVPEKGEANAALERLLAGWLGVPKSTVRVEAGERSRVKSVAIEGDGEALARRAEARLNEDE
jgi:hypothetical protein